jgi:hypothetical protein
MVKAFLRERKATKQKEDGKQNNNSLFFQNILAAGTYTYTFFLSLSLNLTIFLSLYYYLAFSLFLNHYLSFYLSPSLTLPNTRTKIGSSGLFLFWKLKKLKI